MSNEAHDVVDSEGWRLTPADAGDFDELMRWFRTADDVKTWGGPRFRFPFSRATFREDCHWPGMATYVLRDTASELVAFGQFYNRSGRINFARLVAHPNRRGQGIGRRLLEGLMRVSPAQFDLDEFSLFVYRDNMPALCCYESMGFEIQDYPPDQILADECFYLTRPIIAAETAT
ncbi:MAG: GNAT family N-acetyltransferase [Woeseiaceae bacterium]|nr:GNAT family N-acetyltransferase [Woeseiaceae bacterium]